MRLNLMNRARRLLRGATIGRAGGGHTDSARYCYSVWLRHLVKAANVSGRVPSTVAEIGPGRSLGTGLAAMLCGAERLYAFDLLAYTNAASNEKVVDELVELFRARAPIPGQDEFPRVLPLLDSYDFPAWLLSDALLAETVEPKRIDWIKAQLRLTASHDGAIRYVAPWTETARRTNEADVDLVFSQAVMLYVRDLAAAYTAMAAWMKPGALTSHTINFSSIGLAPAWDDHWRYSEAGWRDHVGPVPYEISRHPWSRHRHALRQAGLEPVLVEEEFTAPTMLAGDEDPSFADLTDDDRRTSRVFVIAQRGK